jgi:pyruvate kinase
MSDKDIEDLKFGLSAGVDIVALSFVRSERDVMELRTIMKLFGRNVPIIAKIERYEGYEDIVDIINESDAIMVARGDLGLEMPAEDVPVLQKEIITKCNFYGKPVITATQMLESMISNPRPTRAEASDVANAVIDGTDCVMLSGETSIGGYPFEAVKYMDKIICSTEEKYIHNRTNQTYEKVKFISEALGMASCTIAAQIDAKAIVTETTTGYTAKNIAKYRPDTPIIAVCSSEEISRTLAITWGVYAVTRTSKFPIEDDSDALEILRAKFPCIGQNDYIVYVAGLSGGVTHPKNQLRIVKA